jgi:type I restriction enzyme S subunit
MTGETPAVHEALAAYAPETSETGRVPPGYKQTEVGVIPEDWEVAKLNELVELTSSRRIFEHEYVSSGVPFFRGKEISLLVDRKPIDDLCFIPEKRFNELKSQYGAPEKGDILITAVGTLGNIYVVPEESRFYFKDGNLIWLRKIKDTEPDYIAAQLRRAKTKIIDGSIGSSQRALTIVVLKDVQIAVPPLHEQRAIAAVLSDVDALISALDKLIAKKRAVKTAAMQQLLTGKQRLPGFSGEWEVKSLGEVCSISVGKSKSKYINGGGRYLIVDMGSVSTTGKLISTKRTDYKDDFLNLGDLVMPKDDIGGGNIIGKVAYIDEDNRYVLGDHVYVLKARLGSSLFLSYVINGHDINSVGFPR